MITRKSSIKKSIALLLLGVIMLTIHYGCNHAASDYTEETRLAYPDESSVSMDMPEQIFEACETLAFASFEAVAPVEVQQIIHSDERLMSAAKYAYLDMGTASPQLAERIMEARLVIIEHIGVTIGWYDEAEMTGAYRARFEEDCNGNLVLATDNYGDKILCPLPTFSELFPGWEVPAVS